MEEKNITDFRKRDLSIYNQVTKLIEERPDLTKTQIFKILSPKFGIVDSNLWSIYYKIKKKCKVAIKQ